MKIFKLIVSSIVLYSTLVFCFDTLRDGSSQDEDAYVDSECSFKRGPENKVNTKGFLFENGRRNFDRFSIKVTEGVTNPFANSDQFNHNYGISVDNSSHDIPRNK